MAEASSNNGKAIELGKRLFSDGSFRARYRFINCQWGSAGYVDDTGRNCVESIASYEFRPFGSNSDQPLYVFLAVEAGKERIQFERPQQERKTASDPADFYRQVL